MSMYIPKSATPSSFGDTMAQLGFVTEEERQRLNAEDGFSGSGHLREAKGEGKGKASCEGKNSCKGEGGKKCPECGDHMKDEKSYMKHMKDHMKDEDLDEDDFFEGEDPHAAALARKDDEDPHAAALARKGDDDDEDEEESFFTDGDELSEDDDEDEDEDEEEDDDEEEDEDAEESVSLEDFDLAYDLIEAFGELSDDELDNITLDHFVSVINAQADIIEAYESDAAAILDERMGGTVRQRRTAKGRKQTKFLRRGGAKAAGRRERAKTQRRTKHMSKRAKTRYLAKKTGKSEFDIEKGRAQTRSRAKGGKAERIRRSRMADYMGDVDESQDISGNLFSTIGQLRTMISQPMEAVNHDDLSNKIHAAYDVVENLAAAAAEAMGKEIDEEDVSEEDLRVKAFQMFSTISENARRHHEEMEEGKYEAERAVTNLELLVSDLLRGKEQCKRIA